jgi:YbgC/YbaW family acyl-CoA thioester hydrolase
VTEPIFRLERRVRFQDIDAAGILFYARAFEYFHDAYAAALEAGGVDLPTILREKRWAAPLVHAEADFKAPMRYGDPVAIEIVSGELGHSSLKVRYRVTAANDDAHVYCTGMTAHVFVDAATFAPRAVPDDVRGVFGR